MAIEIGLSRCLAWATNTYQFSKQNQNKDFLYLFWLRAKLCRRSICLVQMQLPATLNSPALAPALAAFVMTLTNCLPYQLFVHV